MSRLFYVEIVEVSFTYCELPSAFECITFREDVGFLF